MPITLLALIAGKAKTAASWVLGLARNHPWQFATAAAIGLAWSQWSGKHEALQARDQVRAALTAEKEGRKSDLAGWQLQVASAKAQTAAAQRKSKEIATDAQASHSALLADNAGLREYIAAHRLRSTPRSGASATADTTGDLGTGVPSATATDAFVATTESDLVACDADYAYAFGAHHFVQGLIAAGLAK